MIDMLARGSSTALEEETPAAAITIFAGAA